MVKLILQFLHEQGLGRSASELMDEAGVALNNVDNKESFLSDVRHGRWEAVLPVVSPVTHSTTHPGPHWIHVGVPKVSRMKLPLPLLMSLYEQVVLELLEAREVDLARELLRTTTAMHLMRKDDPERYHELDVLAQRPVFDATAAYGSGGKEKRRSDIAERMMPHAVVVPPSRLLALLGQSLKWQKHNGLLPKSGELHLRPPTPRFTMPHAYTPPPTHTSSSFHTQPVREWTRCTPSRFDLR